MRDFRVYYGIPTYTQFKRAKDNIATILATSTLVPDQFVVIDNSEKGLAIPIFQDMLAVFSKVQVIPRANNILAGAWNDLMNVFSDDYIIIANDDVTPHPHSIESMVTLARENPSFAMINGSGHSGNSYSFFLLRKWAYEQIGPFDEGFYPAYFEDNDYDRRKDLLGLIRVSDPNATFDHYGSATMRLMDASRQAKHHVSFGRNRMRYIRKHGGIPGEEKFTSPFQRDSTLDDD